MPGAVVRLWDDSTVPNTPFIHFAREKPINVSNYMKYWTLYNFGGVFLDCDVELLRPFDLAGEAFVAFQRDDTEEDCINTAVIGAAPGNAFIKRCLDRVEAAGGDYVWPVFLGCTIPTEELRADGMKGLNIEQAVGTTTVYSKDRFYPWGYGEDPDRSRITERTFAAHHWRGSWIN